MTDSASTLSIVAWSLAGVCGVVGSALCSGAELGTYSVNRVRLDLRAVRTPPDGAARTLKAELERPARIIVTLLIGNTLFTGLGSQATTALLGSSGATERFTLLFNVLVLGPLLFVFSEALPKELFRLDADRLTYLLARPLSWMRTLFTLIGLVPIVGAVASWCERIAGLKESAEEASRHLGDARARMTDLLKESGLSGAISASQASLVDRALAMRDATVEAEMVRWSDVRAIPAHWDRAMVVKNVSHQSNSRFPVLDRSGRVVGVLRQVDIYVRTEGQWTDLLTPPARLTPDMPLLDALRAVMETPSRMGVVERSGRPVGLVTAKDLAEPLTGELPDW